MGNGDHPFSKGERKKKEYHEGLRSWGRRRCSVRMKRTVRSLGEGCFGQIMELKCVSEGKTTQGTGNGLQAMSKGIMGSKGLVGEYTPFCCGPALPLRRGSKLPSSCCTDTL